MQTQSGNYEVLHVKSETVHELTLAGKDLDALSEFVKHRELFELLLSRGVFNTKSGSVTLHFDSIGALKLIETAQVVKLSTF